jgi:retron-type reverse transcriptase
MQRAETLLEIIHERGKRGSPLERLYRHLFNPELYLRAYGKIYRNDGSMTPGVNEETVDGMSLKKIQAIIDALRCERYRWTPVRRVYIDKKGSPGKRRPLGLPTWSDKLLQEVIRSLQARSGELPDDAVSIDEVRMKFGARIAAGQRAGHDV